jgi:hypothetical protein
MTDYDDANPTGTTPMPMSQRRFSAAPSALQLVWGIILLVLGQALWLVGQQQALQASLIGPRYSDSSGGMPLIVIGGLASLAGLIALLTGVWKLASSIDYLAKRTVDRDVARSKP